MAKISKVTPPETAPTDIAVPVETPPVQKKRASPTKKSTGSKTPKTPKITPATIKNDLGYCSGTFSWYPISSFTKDPRYSDEYLSRKA